MARSKKGNYKKKCANPLKIHKNAAVKETNRQLQSNKILSEHLDEMKKKFNLDKLSWLCIDCIKKLNETVDKKSEETNEDSASTAVSSTSSSLNIEKVQNSTDEEMSAASDLDANFSTSDDDNIKEHSMEVVNEVLKQCNVTPQKSPK